VRVRVPCIRRRQARRGRIQRCLLRVTRIVGEAAGVRDAKRGPQEPGDQRQCERRTQHVQPPQSCEHREYSQATV
jgi:hypothetical protein